MFKNITNVLQKHKWRKLAEKALEKKTLTGFYNHNYKLYDGDTPYLFRFPIKDAPRMDPRAFEEQDVLKLLSGQSISVPKLICDDLEKGFYVEAFIDGFTLDNRYPPGKKIPEKYLDQIAQFYYDTTQLETGAFKGIIDKAWPTSGSNALFFEAVCAFSEKVFERSRKTHGKYYDFLGLGDDPYAVLKEKAKDLAERPWCFMHADLHRGNIMVDRQDRLWFIDWELGLYGDILLCIAAHLHRTRYFEAEREMLIGKIKQQLPQNFLINFDQDLDFYLTFEAMKSVITDTVRFPQAFKEEKFSTKREAEYCLYYSDNLNRIAPLLGCKTATPSDALHWFQEWG